MNRKHRRHPCNMTHDTLTDQGQTPEARMGFHRIGLDDTLPKRDTYVRMSQVELEPESQRSGTYARGSIKAPEARGARRNSVQYSHTVVSSKPLHVIYFPMYRTRGVRLRARSLTYSHEAPKTRVVIATALSGRSERHQAAPAPAGGHQKELIPAIVTPRECGGTIMDPAGGQFIIIGASSTCIRWPSLRGISSLLPQMVLR